MSNTNFLNNQKGISGKETFFRIHPPISNYLLNRRKYSVNHVVTIKLDTKLCRKLYRKLCRSPAPPCIWCATYHATVILMSRVSKNHQYPQNTRNSFLRQRLRQSVRQSLTVTPRYYITTVPCAGGDATWFTEDLRRTDGYVNDAKFLNGT